MTIITTPQYTLYNGDCRDFMRGMEAGSVVTVTDPPYGLGKKNTGGGRNTIAELHWDNVDPSAVFSAVSLGKKSIVWGGNYYALPPSRRWLVWYKRDSVPSAADCELAWTSEDANSLVFDWTIAATNAERVGHPTQKPIALMRWCIELVSAPGDVIFDPFMGSGTTGVAALQLGRRFIGCELDAGYFAIAKRRIEQAAAQPLLIAPQRETVEQQTLPIAQRGERA